MYGIISLCIVLLIGATSALECPANSIGRIADPSECSRYILCDGGSLQTMYCNGGQEFNRQLQVCQTPIVPGCLNLFLSSLVEGSPRVPFCPLDQNTTIYLPHETLCTKFYSCYMGVLTAFDCAGGTEFDPEKGNCDWISEDGCTLRTTPKAPTTDGVTDSTLIEEETTEVPSTPEEASTEVLSTTEDTPTEEAPTEEAITEETTIETSTSEASTAEVIETTTMEYTTESQSTTTKRPICSGITVGLEPHESDCTKYYFCLSGTPQMFQCPDGQEFDINAQGCIDITGNGCIEIHPTTEAPTTEEPETTTMEYTTEPQSTTTKKPICSGITVGLEAHETDCNKFYFCINSIPQMYECPEGQEFNMEARGCIDITGSGCTTTIAPTTEEPTTEALTTEEPTTEALTTEVPTVVPETTTGPAPCSGAGLFEPHPTDCTKYYFCFNGAPQVLECPDGKEFDANALICVDITSDGCSSNNEAWFGFLGYI
ncbi:uncharacterized protein LOC143913057 [Arctopsyche grandis]|uniref:uncharacterized protein LOC143913057 n=1 Tax=Arctopsyche grandis TaxID=121162 RepID=UPI00406D886D